jgi:hypothetical protein
LDKPAGRVSHGAGAPAANPGGRGAAANQSGQQDQRYKRKRFACLLPVRHTIFLFHLSPYKGVTNRVTQVTNWKNEEIFFVAER